MVSFKGVCHCNWRWRAQETKKRRGIEDLRNGGDKRVERGVYELGFVPTRGKFRASKCP